MIRDDSKLWGNAGGRKNDREKIWRKIRWEIRKKTALHLFEQGEEIEAISKATELSPDRSSIWPSPFTHALGCKKTAADWS